MTLPQYLQQVAARRGILDCCAFMADWLMANGFPDPMADRRGTYTHREWGALLDSEGGILASCSNRFKAIGLRETDEPKAGDLAVVMAQFPTGAICTSSTQRALVATDVALVITSVPTLKAWRVNPCLM